MPKIIKKVAFSRFDVIEIYTWTGPVDGFQTKKEFIAAVQEMLLDKKKNK